MVYEYSLPTGEKIAMGLMVVLLSVSLVFVCLSGEHIVLVLLFCAMCALAARNLFVLLPQLPFRVCVKQDEVMVLRRLGRRSCSRDDILGVETNVPCGPHCVQTRIHLRSGRRYLAVDEAWKKPLVVRDTSSGDERELSSLLVEWFGAYTPENGSENQDGPSRFPQADMVEGNSRVPCVQAEEVSCLYSYPVKWIRTCLLLAFPIVAGVASCIFCVQHMNNTKAGIVSLAMCMLGFGVLVFCQFHYLRKFRVTQDGVQVRTLRGWKAYPRTEILGVETDIPVWMEMRSTCIHIKGCCGGFSVVEERSDPIIVRDEHSGRELELVPLLVELFGTYTPEYNENTWPMRRKRNE